ncbi:DUF4007 family protein [Oricola nitratireducens]|uniref:DUF4007 family protein n=1 Tax=Oricola nitratireducens TaxID=2775868 RepID=UPI0018684ACD|nr:DUF4007 family protein [Oricola nitratireducens]
MARSIIYSDQYKPQFSGHETFPLRYGWLKKAADAVSGCKNGAETRKIFLEEDAISRFGVGRNMVSSIRFWAMATKMICEASSAGPIELSPMARRILSDNGLDPFMENPATLWLIHWELCSNPDRTTWYWFFNHFAGLSFEREDLVSALVALADERQWPRVSAATVKRDVECFVRTYAARPTTASVTGEDILESPLTELGLIQATGKKDGFRVVRGPKSSLGEGVFAYALVDFWSKYSDSNTLSFEAIAHEPGSPGRVFLLDENELAERLSDIEETTAGAIQWSETAGLKQLLRRAQVPTENALTFLELDYRVHDKMEAA